MYGSANQRTTGNTRWVTRSPGMQSVGLPSSRSSAESLPKKEQVNGEVRCGGWDLDLAVLQPVEQPADGVVLLGQVPIQRHDRLRYYLAHDRPFASARPTDGRT